MGGCSSIRDSLKELKDIVHSAFWGNTELKLKGDVLNALRRANLALEKPRKNCERFDSIEEALEAYNAWVRSKREAGYFGELPDYDEWLFEKEE